MEADPAVARFLGELAQHLGDRYPDEPVVVRIQVGVTTDLVFGVEVEFPQVPWLMRFLIAFVVLDHCLPSFPTSVAERIIQVREAFGDDLLRYRTAYPEGWGSSSEAVSNLGAMRVGIDYGVVPFRLEGEVQG